MPFHLDGAPVMRFIEESLRYFKDFFQARIIRLPHIGFYRQLGNVLFQPPERIRIIQSLGFDQCTKLTYNDVRRWLAEDLGWPEAKTSGQRPASTPPIRPAGAFTLSKAGRATIPNSSFIPPSIDVMAITETTFSRRQKKRESQVYVMR